MAINEEHCLNGSSRGYRSSGTSRLNCCGARPVARGSYLTLSQGLAGLENWADPAENAMDEVARGGSCSRRDQQTHMSYSQT